MTQTSPDALSPKLRAAVDDLVKLIRTHYPAATIEIAPFPEDPEVVHVYPTVDIDEPVEVLDLVLPRMLALQDEGVPIHVIPLRSQAAEERMRACDQAELLGPAVPHGR